MSTQSSPLSKAEVAKSLRELQLPAVVTTKALANLLGLSVKTVYLWRAIGRLEGTYRKRGKHVLFFTERVIILIFNGPKWK